MELEQLAAQASQVMKEAGAVIRAIPRPKIYTKEGHANFVTEGDVASQNYLMEHLSPLLPEAHFFAEEQEENQLAPGYNWVIDPIDGTTNFIRGYQSWCISVGLVLDGEGLLLSLIHIFYFAKPTSLYALHTPWIFRNIAGLSVPLFQTT